MKKVIKLLGLIIVVLFVALFFIYKSTISKVEKIPVNSPKICTGNASANPFIVNLGDSLTHGTVSYNYVNILQEKFADYQFVNAGINLQLAYNVFQRLDEVIACNPKYITVFIGCNDVNATLTAVKTQEYIEELKLPETPNLKFYQDNIHKIITKLKAQTTAKIALVSISVIGEEIESVANIRIKKYNKFLKDYAGKNEITYLPVFEEQINYLKTKEFITEKCREGKYHIEAAVASHYLLGDSWAEISAANGFHLTTDCLHLNKTAADMFAKYIGTFIESN